MAKKHSSCPSARSGGELGEFSPGEMVKEFDTVVFTKEVGKVHGPVLIRVPPNSNYKARLKRIGFYGDGCGRGWGEREILQEN